MGKWLLIDRTRSGEASGISGKRFCAALEKAGAEYEKKNAWTGAFPDNTVVLAPNTDPIVYNLAPEIAAAPESVQMFRAGGAAVLSGSDERGLAYAAMEMAERVEASGERALRELARETRSPTVRVRGIDRIVLNTGDESWWMSESYWRGYLERMLAARYNRIVLLVGFDTSYLSPPYPYFVDVPEYPGARVVEPGFDRGAYREALRRLGRLAHEYGMDFTFATWQQSNWLASQKSRVEGIEDLMLYCSAGIRELALQCPEIDTIQLRVNHEAGVGTQITAEEYWFRQLDGLAEALRRGARTKLDMRAKGLTDPMIRYAKDLGIDLTVSTKYWCEQAGLPHHLTRMRTEELLRLDNLNHSRRYSYSDMLKKPRLHKFLYRLWNDGSTDILTWGDPDYVRRFVSSMRLGRADGFEIMPLLSLKGGPQDGMVAGWNLFDDPAYQPEGCEDSRYWLCDRLFGRIGYDLGEAEEAWMRPMRQKFGAASEPMMAAISAASRLIPLIVGSHMPVHPQLCYWAEFSTGGALFAENNRNPAIRRAGVTYQSTEPGDAGLFYPIREYARDYVAGAEDGRYTPWQVAGALAGISRGAEKYLGMAEEAGMPDSSEARGAALDLRMLSSLALYHRHKIAASVALCLHEETGDAEWLGESLASMRLARGHWARYAELGQKYHSRLTFYSGDYSVCRDGNWKDFYAELDADVERLSQMALGREGAAGHAEPAAGRAEPAQGGGGAGQEGGVAAEHGESAQSGGAAAQAGRCRYLEAEAGADMRPMCWTDDVPASCRAGEPLKIALFVPLQEAFRGCVSMRYRHTNQLEGKFLSAPMELRGGAWRGEIPAGYIVPEWDLLVYFDAVSPSGDGMPYPGVWHPQHMLPYHIVEVEEARGEAAEAQV